MKKIILLFVWIISMLYDANRLDAQCTNKEWLPTYYDNSTGNEIYRVGYTVMRVSPYTKSKLKANEKSILNLSIKFDDLDATKCPNETKFKKGQGANNMYDITFNIDTKDNVASFEENSITKSKTVKSRTLPKLNDYFLYTNETVVTVYFKDDWTIKKKQIDVTVTVKDITALPAGNSGIIQDEPQELYTFKFTYNDLLIPCPIQKQSNIANNLWNTVRTEKYMNNGEMDINDKPIDYIYELLPDKKNNGKSDFENALIIEKFGQFKADNIFDINDVRSAFKNKNNLFSADKIADFLFRNSIGSAATFLISDDGLLTDSHGAFYLNDNMLEAFGSKIEKCGFNIEQEYLCKGNTLIGNKNSLSKKVSNPIFDSTGDLISFDIQVQKNH